MPIVKAGDLAAWAGALPADELVSIGDWEGEDSSVLPKPVVKIAKRRYLYRWPDAPSLGFVSANSVEEKMDDTEKGCHEWCGMSIWRLGR